MDSQFSQQIRSAEICGEILSRSRVKANLCRREMAERLGVSESTIKGWESGFGSPTLSVLIEWYIATGCNLFKSLLDFLWPDIFFRVNESGSQEALQKAITVYFQKVAGNHEIKRIHHLVFNSDSERWSNLLELFCAFTQLALPERYRIARLNQTAFDICKLNGTVQIPAFEDGNYVLETAAILSAEEAIAGSKPGYMVGFFELSSDKVAASIMKKARLDSNISIAQMAQAMCKSNRTVQNWESTSPPSFLEMNIWFRILDKSMWSYLRNCLVPYESPDIEQSSELLRNELVQYFLAAPLRELRMISYFILGEYGSYSNAVLELIMQYSCLPLSMRALIAHSIIVEYELYKKGTPAGSTGNICPDMDRLKETFASTMKVFENC